MNDHDRHTAKGRGLGARLPLWLGLCGLLVIAAFFLWSEHRAHALGALPYLLFLLCPVIHLFMHGGHGHRQEAAQSASAKRSQGASS